ncbi:MFS transporter [Ketogulonicigenium vulgare]|uniref:Transporter n=2 Tax=Ketogulonicigenium vulgare TaxID=92945 RepID=F9Y808_KETVW|nr:MFS transporter [Ketogulonicigenium vulgare]AEM41134.1 transporter [Ketogulonicigenium vulgare WSH-001]ALJ81273.1 hypothetical protein KVH_08820 [Ketogulonicigenium vulgare]AOZ54856.1 transporter [Ketogulonicigenium vulgare]
MTDTTSARDDVSRNIYIVMAAGLAGSANIRSLDSVLPQISGEMGVSLGQAAYLGAGYALAYGLCQLPFGMLGDRMNRLFLVKVLTCLSVALLIVTAFAPNYPALLGLRILAGAASSAIIPLSISYIGDNVPFERRQMVLAMNMTAITTGMVLGQAFGGIVADVTGWRGIPIFIALLYLPAVVGFWGQKRSGGAAKPSPLPLGTALGRIAKTPFSRAVLGAVFVEGALIMAMTAFCAIMLTLRFNMPLSLVGLSMALVAFGGVMNLPVLKYWPAGWGMRAHFMASGLCAALGYGLVGLSPYLPLTLVGLFLAGLGSTAMHNNLQTFGSQLLPEARGTGFSTFATTFFLAQSAGSLVQAFVLDHVGIMWVFLWPLPLIIALSLWFPRLMRK